MSKLYPIRWLVFLLLMTAPAAQAQLEPLYLDQGVVGLGLALRTLPVCGSVLYVAAHPDDENDGLLFYLRRTLGMRTGFLSVTRGEGGQNEIGPELFEALGILRTEELLSVQRTLGGQQFFTRAFEFGYSFSVEETLEKWGKEATLRDMVRTIRQFRPLVVLTLPPGGTGGGQHHQATSRLTAEAFRIAADPQHYPEQIAAGLAPWQSRKLYQVQSFEGSHDETGRVPLRVSYGEMDSLLGESPAQLGARARSNHRCQGMNALPEAGEQSAAYVLADVAPGVTRVPGNEEKSFFDGLDTSLVGLVQYVRQEENQVPFLRVALLSLQASIETAQSSFRTGHLEEVAGFVLQGLKNSESLLAQVQQSRLSAEAKSRLVPFLEYKVQDFRQAGHAAAFVQLEAFQTPEPAVRRSLDPGEPAPQIDGRVTRGESFLIGIRFLNRGSRSLIVEKVRLRAPMGWKVDRISGAEGPVHAQKELRCLYRVTVADEARYTQPYWYRKTRDDFRYEIDNPQWDGLPFAPPDLVAEADYLLEGYSSELRNTLTAPVQYRWYDVAAAKERRMTVNVVPKLSVTMTPRVLLVPSGGSGLERTLQVSIQNNGPGPAAPDVSLLLPSGWSAVPAAAKIQLDRENETASVRFNVRIPASLKTGDQSIQAEARLGAEPFRAGHQTIAYHHIQTRYLYHPASVAVRMLDFKIPTGLHVGYVMGVGDEVPEALTQMGAEVTLLGAEDLAYGDLNGYDAIVTGIRAYKDRADLIAHNQRLLNYVRDGGHLVVQYNKYEYNRARYGPYPAVINLPHDRVTDENSAVRILMPDHPVFLRPNRITEEDWKGWVQERGLYFLGKWDLRYRPLLELQDPFEYNHLPKQGGLVMAVYGKGTFVYTGLGFFRQLPEGVSGAYRLFANLVSLKRTWSSAAVPSR